MNTYISQPLRNTLQRKMETSMGRVVQVNDRDFDTEVIGSTIPVLVDFYEDWCGPCKIVAPTMETLSKEYVAKVKFVKVNEENNPEVASKYDILRIPQA